MYTLKYGLSPYTDVDKHASKILLLAGFQNRYINANINFSQVKL